MTTVTPGELKIIEANVRGLSNKEDYVKKFLSRKKKKADIFCIIEHKITQNRALIGKFSSGSYRVGASNCRGTSAGGVALLVHEKLGNVKDVQEDFKDEINVARSKGVEIAVILLKLKAKDCQYPLLVFGIYRRASTCAQHSMFSNIVCGLIGKVNMFSSSAVFTGDFNFNNSNEAQLSRDNKSREIIIKFTSLGYKLTHKTPSHLLGSCLNNFLVPLNLKYSQKTITEGFKIPEKPRKKNSPKEPDHLPIQLVITLEPNLNQGSQPLQGNMQNNSRSRLLGHYGDNQNTTTYKPSISESQYIKSVSQVEERPDTPDDVIVISSDDETIPSTIQESSAQSGSKRKRFSVQGSQPDASLGHLNLSQSQSNQPVASLGYLNLSQSQSNQPQSISLQVGHDVTETPVIKIEGESEGSQKNLNSVSNTSSKESRISGKSFLDVSSNATNQSTSQANRNEPNSHHQYPIIPNDGAVTIGDNYRTDFQSDRSVFSKSDRPKHLPNISSTISTNQASFAAENTNSSLNDIEGAIPRTNNETRHTLSNPPINEKRPLFIEMLRNNYQWLSRGNEQSILLNSRIYQDVRRENTVTTSYEELNLQARFVREHPCQPVQGTSSRTDDLSQDLEELKELNRRKRQLEIIAEYEEIEQRRAQILQKIQRRDI